MNTVDAYSRYMAPYFEGKFSASTVWQQFFGKFQNNGSLSHFSPDSEVVDIDISRANGRPLAALIHRGTDSRYLNKQKNTELQKWSSFSRKYPLAEELADITASQLLKRAFGENPYEERAQRERLRALAVRYHSEHVRRYTRLFEYLAGLSLLGGQHPAVTDSANADDWYDFRRSATHIVSPTVPWDNAAADIIGDWDAALTIGRQDADVTYNVAFAGENLVKIILDDSTFEKYADNRRYELIRVGRDGFQLPAEFNALVQAGANPIAKVMTPLGRTFFIFAYDAIYTDSNGDTQHYMPVNSFFFAFYGARCDRYFGPNERLPLTPDEVAWYQMLFGMNMNVPMIPMDIKNPDAVITPNMFYCDAYPSPDKKKVTLRTQSAPIFATTETDAFFTYYQCLTVSS